MSTISSFSSIFSTEESVDSKSDSNSDSSTMDNPTKEQTTVLNKRKSIILFTISAIAILILIMIVAITIPLLYAYKTPKQTSSSINNDQPASTTTIVTPVATYDVGGGGIDGDAPCSSHTVVNDPLRNVDAPGAGGSCDVGPLFNTRIGGRWIRFIGTGGTVIPTMTPGRQHCGAYLSGWFHGTLPSTSGMIVNGSVCIDIVAKQCGYEVPILIVKCADFYVYFLPPMLMCNARYCTI